jgi:hypothetical protein
MGIQMVNTKNSAVSGVFKAWRLSVCAIALVVVACGGGGGGGTTDTPPGGPGGGPTGGARTGRVTFGDIYNVAYIDTASKDENFYTTLTNKDGGGCDRSFDSWKYLTHSAAANGQVSVSFNCDLLQKNSKIVIYNADRTIADTRYFNTIRLSGYTQISPSGRYIFATLRDTLLGLNVPDTYQDILIDRNNNNSESVFNLPNSGATWVSDDVLLFQVTGGFKTWKVGDAQASDLIPNTQGGYLPTVSPDGKRIAFLVAPNPQATPDIFMVNIDGSNRRQVTSNGVATERPAFSPSGTELLIRKGICYTSTFGDGYGLQVIPADATMLDVPDIQPSTIVGGGSDSPYALRSKKGDRVCLSNGNVTWK